VIGLLAGLSENQISIPAWGKDFSVRQCIETGSLVKSPLYLTDAMDSFPCGKVTARGSNFPILSIAIKKQPRKKVKAHTGL
jgi:hypothetical protein